LNQGFILGNNQERAMKNLQIRSAVLLLSTLCLLIGAYAQITPSADAYTNTADPTTNYGAATLLDVDGATQAAYIQFNLSSIPTGASIGQATLKLYVNAVTTAGAFEVYSVNGPWAENTITYNLAPALGSVIDSSVALTKAAKNQYILIPITATVQGWVNTPSSNNGIALVANGTFNASFDSKENTTTSHPAELDIVFAGDGTITGVTTASGSGLTGGGTSGTLNLSLTSACSANQVLQWTGTAWACASAGTGTITGVTAGTDLTGGGTSGSVTLNLDTTKVPQLVANNAFTGTQTISGTEAITGASTTETLNVWQAGFQATGDGIHGITSASGGTGVFGEGAIGIQGLASPSSGLSGLFRGTVKITGNGNNLLAGDPGCGSGFAGFGAPASGSLSGCTNYALIGGPKGDTYVNSSGTASIHFRSNNNELATIDNSGNIKVIGQSGGGNLTVAGNLTVGGQVLTSNQNINGDLTVNGTGTSQALGAYGAPASPSMGPETGILARGGGGGGTGILAYGGGGSGDGGEFYGGNDAPNYGGSGATFAGGFSYQWGGDGIIASPGAGTSSGGPGYAAYFNGNIDVTGSSANNADDLKIDHPLDPANQYLFHSAVESSEMMNIYTGNVTTDSQGWATVQLPDWFEALNTDFRYQLTVIGQFAQAIVASEIGHNQFGIRTDKPNVKVSWQVTGVRQDAYANANPLVVEQAKDARERGHYIHPELYGASEQQSIEWARHPEMMKKMQEMRARQLAASQKQATPRN
jgi:trimeric autotransporter adhesin